MKNKLLLGFIFTYIIFITLFSVMFFYTIITLNNSENMNAVTSDITKHLDNHQAEVENIVARGYDHSLVLGFNEWVQKYAYQEEISVEGYVEFNQISDYLSINEFASEREGSLCIYFEKSNTFVNSKTSGLYAQVFFESHLKGVKSADKELNFDEYVEELKAIPSGGVDILYDDKNIYLNYEIENLKEPVYLIYSIDKSKFIYEELLVDFYEDSTFYLKDKNSNNIIEIGNIDSSLSNHTNFSMEIDYLGLTYDFYISKSDIFSVGDNFLLPYLPFYFIILIICLVLSYFLSKRFNLPVLKLMSKMNVNDSYSFNDVINQIDSELDNIVTQKTFLENSISNYNEVLLSSFFSKLIKGYIFSFSELKIIGELVPEFFMCSNYSVIVFEHRKRELSDDLEKSIVEISKEISKELDYNMYLVGISDTRAAIITCSEKSNNDEIAEKAIKIIENSVFNNKLKIGLGSTVSMPDYCYISFQRAIMAVKHLSDEASVNVLKYDDLHLDADMFSYTLEDEKRILQAIKTNNYYIAKQTIYNIIDVFSEVDTTKNLSRIVSALIFTMKRAQNEFANIEHSDNIKIEDYLRQAEINSSPKIIYNSFSSILDIYISLSKNGNVENETIISIKEYINKNYSDSNLSLSQIASEINLSESYLSSIFKQHTDETVSSYIEKTRLEKAKELLIANKYSVEKISELTGYNTANTFYKAFKRVYKVTPNQYKTMFYQSQGDK